MLGVGEAVLEHAPCAVVDFGSPQDIHADILCCKIEATYACEQGADRQVCPCGYRTPIRLFGIEMGDVLSAGVLRTHSRGSKVDVSSPMVRATHCMKGIFGALLVISILPPVDSAV